jgi:hypothetical protein
MLRSEVIGWNSLGLIPLDDLVILPDMKPGHGDYGGHVTRIG